MCFCLFYQILPSLARCLYTRMTTRFLAFWLLLLPGLLLRSFVCKGSLLNREAAIAKAQRNLWMVSIERLFCCAKISVLCKYCEIFCLSLWTLDRQFFHPSLEVRVCLLQWPPRFWSSALMFDQRQRVTPPPNDQAGGSVIRTGFLVCLGLGYEVSPFFRNKGKICFWQ